MIQRITEGISGLEAANLIYSNDLVAETVNSVIFDGGIDTQPIVLAPIREQDGFINRTSGAISTVATGWHTYTYAVDLAAFSALLASGDTLAASTCIAGFYDENEQFLGPFGQGTGDAQRHTDVTLTGVPAGTRFIKVNSREPSPLPVLVAQASMSYRTKAETDKIEASLFALRTPENGVYTELEPVEILEGRCIDPSDGTLRPLASWHTKRCRVVSGDLYVSGRTALETTCLLAWYDGADNFIKSEYVGTGSETLYVNVAVQAPANAVYIRINGTSAQGAAMSFEGRYVFSDISQAVFAPSATLPYDPNVAGAITSLVLFNQTIRETLYLKQFGRYAGTGEGGNRRWYLEIWDSDTDALAYGADNPTGRWTNNTDFKGVEQKYIYNQAGVVVGSVVFNWANAWPSGGYLDTGTLASAQLSTDIFKFIPQAGGTSRWAGKRLVSNGDSIMAASNSFLVRAAQQLGMVLVQNYAIGGSTIAQRAAQPTQRDPIVIRYTAMDDDADIVIIAASTNDCNYSWTPWGEFTDRTPNTFLGAAHMLCRGLKEKYVGKTILFLTAIKRNQDLPTPESTNGEGKTQKDYADALKEVCAYWGIPVLDMFSECILNPFLPEYVAAYMSDGTHPNAAGHAIMADRLVGYLNQL